MGEPESAVQIVDPTEQAVGAPVSATVPAVTLPTHPDDLADQSEEDLEQAEELAVVAQTTVDRVSRSVTVASLVLRAKTKFLGLLKKRDDRDRRKRRGTGTLANWGALAEDVQARERERREKEQLSRGMHVIDKCPRLRDLH